MAKDMVRVKNIPKMVPSVVQDYLYEIGCSWTGQGIAIELGSWLGGTAVPLLQGLNTVGYDKPFYCNESWEANEQQVKKALIQGVTLHNKQNTLPIFLKNVTSIYSNIKATKGKLGDTLHKYKGGNIEICIFDAPKQNPVFSEAVRILSPYWIPGVTVLGLLDYYFYRSRLEPLREKFKVPVRFIKENKDCFEKIAEWPDQCSCVFFKYVKELKL